MSPPMSLSLEEYAAHDGLVLAACEQVNEELDAVVTEIFEHARE